MTAVRSGSTRSRSAAATRAPARSAASTKRASSAATSARARTGTSARARAGTSTRTASSTRARSTASSTVARSSRARSSRGVVRSSPGGATGPRLRVLPRRVVSLRALIVLSGVLFFGVLFGAVAIQAQRIEGQREIDRLDRTILEQQDANRMLRAEVAERESPARIMAEARALDMVEPGPIAPLIAGVPLTTAPLDEGSPSDPTDDVVAAGSEVPAR